MEYGVWSIVHQRRLDKQEGREQESKESKERKESEKSEEGEKNEKIERFRTLSRLNLRLTLLIEEKKEPKSAQLVSSSGLLYSLLFTLNS